MLCGVILLCASQQSQPTLSRSTGMGGWTRPRFATRTCAAPLGGARVDLLGVPTRRCRPAIKFAVCARRLALGGGVLLPH